MSTTDGTPGDRAVAERRAKLAKAFGSNGLRALVRANDIEVDGTLTHEGMLTALAAADDVTVPGADER